MGRDGRRRAQYNVETRGRIIITRDQHERGDQRRLFRSERQRNARQTGGAYDPQWVEGKLSRLMETLEEVLDRSEAEKRPTHEIADAIAEARIAAAAERKAEQLKAA